MKSSAFVTSSLPALVAAWLLAGSALAAAPGGDMSAIPAATFAPLYSPESTAAAAKDVPAFRLDKRPVTNAEYAAFVAAHPEWAREKAPKLFRDEGYLRHWAAHTKPASADAKLPVVNVSWYAARAYCKAQGKRLPNEIEWERAAAAGRKQPDMRNEPGAQREMLTWYTAPAQARLRAVGGGEPNYWGLYDLHSLVWEWVDDFNASLTTGDNRADADEDRQLFCGGAAGMAGDRADYAAYQRFAFRSSLQPSYTGKQLGFRCAAAAGDPFADSLYWLASTWTTDTGTPVTLRAWEGKPVVLVMLYTGCKAACPIMIEDLKGVQAKLTPEERESVSFVIASLDPKGDTPAQLAKFKAKVPQAKTWSFLHGDGDAVRELAAALGIRYRWMGNDLMHTNLITVLDRQGRIGHQTMGLRAPPEPTVSAVREQLKKP